MTSYKLFLTCFLSFINLSKPFYAPYIFPTSAFTYLSKFYFSCAEYFLSSFKNKSCHGGYFFSPFKPGSDSSKNRAALVTSVPVKSPPLWKILFDCGYCSQWKLQATILAKRPALLFSQTHPLVTAFKHNWVIISKCSSCLAKKLVTWKLPLVVASSSFIFLRCFGFSFF